MELIFSGTSLKQCLKKASEELNIPEEELLYTKVKEKKRFLLKNIIDIKILNELEDVEKISLSPNDDFIKTEDYGVKVEDGRIQVNIVDKNDKVLIKKCDEIQLFLNGEECDVISNPDNEDIITYKFKEDKATRKLDISLSNSSMEAYADLILKPKCIYEIKEEGYVKELQLKAILKEEIYPPKYTEEEIKNILNEKKIVYGIIDEAIGKLCNITQCTNLLIAKGRKVVDDIQDTIQLKFNLSHKVVDDLDSFERIDYRNRFCIANVKKGDILAKIIKGKDGKDGVNIFGAVMKRKKSNPLIYKVGENCEEINNEIISKIEGKASFKSNIFSVNQFYSVDEVNLESGNVNFIGDVDVQKNVYEGMEIVCGNNLNIGKNLDSAKVNAGGNITIGGSAINSSIVAGEHSVKLDNHLENLDKTSVLIDNIILALKQLEDKMGLPDNKCGQVVKTLLETKFKSLPTFLKDIVSYYEFKDIKDCEILSFAKKKLLGFGPLNINGIRDMEHFQELILNEVDEISKNLVVQSDVYINYSQCCNIEASGNIFVTGKGQYTSEMRALDTIEFLDDSSVCRGGVMSANMKIKLKSVGSLSGVRTILKVSEKGRISANIAYNNTILYFGKKHTVLDCVCKNLIGYLDECGEIVINKLLV